MKKLLLLTGVCAVLVCASAYAAEPITTAFVDSAGQTIGTATLQEMKDGTLITVDLQLPEGTHAMHVHENGKCDAPDFKTAGGHFNPTHHKHGYESAAGYHAGDLPNLYVESTGHVKAEVFSTHLRLTGKNALSQGAIVIHEKADDYSTDPSGNAGGRIACAVIKP